MDNGTMLVAEEPRARRTAADIRRAVQQTRIERHHVIDIPLEKVRPWPGQPRKHFDEKEIEKLSLSIAEFGQKTPIEVKPDPEKEGYFGITDGERRWRACIRCKRPTIRAIIVLDANERERLVTSSICNFNRRGHAPFENACMVRGLTNYGYSVSDIMVMLGKSNCWVWQHKALTRLDERVIALMGYDRPFESRLKFATALLLTALPGDLQFSIAKGITDNQMRSKAARHYVQVKAAEAGFVVGGVAKRPEKRRGSLKSLVVLLAESLPTFLQAPDISLIDFFAKFPRDELAELLPMALKSLEGWQTLCETAADVLNGMQADKSRRDKQTKMPPKASPKKKKKG